MEPHVPIPQCSEAHIWRFDTAVNFPNLQKTLSVLNCDEITYADKLSSEQSAKEYIAGRMIMRLAFAEYLDLPATELKLVSNKRLKPFVESCPELGSSLTHSRGMVVWCCAPCHLVGVDIESYCRVSEPLPRWDQVIYRTSILDDLPNKDNANLLRCWVRKEAALKAWGVGLAFPMQRVRLSGSEQLGQYRAVAETGGEGAWLNVWDLDILDGFYCALATNGALTDLCLIDLQLTPEE